MVLVIHLAPKGTTMHNLTIDKNWLVPVVLPFSKSVSKSQNRKYVGNSQNRKYVCESQNRNTRMIDCCF